MPGSVKSPRVSVLVPVYNSAPYLAETIRSVLDQTFTDFELLLGDDCSTDGSLEIARSLDDPRIRIIINDSNIGNGETRNKLVTMARGEYCAMLDHDDVCYPYRLQTQVDFLDSHSEVDVCSGPVDVIDQNGLLTGQRWFGETRNHDQIAAKFLFSCPLANVTLMFRRERYLVHNLKYESGGADDMTMLLHAIKVLRFENLETPLVKYRVWQGQITHSKPADITHPAVGVLAELHKELGIRVNDDYKRTLLSVLNYDLRPAVLGPLRKIGLGLLRANSKKKIYDQAELALNLLYLDKIFPANSDSLLRLRTKLYRWRIKRFNPKPDRTSPLMPYYYE